jgi:hypothetical protein
LLMTPAGTKLEEIGWLTEWMWAVVKLNMIDEHFLRNLQGQM